MIYKKKVNSGPWAKKGEDYKDGDTIVIANEGHTDTSGDFGPREVFLVKLANGEEKNLAFNQTSINGLVDAFGEDSKNWIGKEARVHLIKQNVAGKFVQVTYIAHPDAELTEDGFRMPTDLLNTTGEANADDIPFLE